MAPALPKALEAAYQAAERIFRSIARAFEGPPAGAEWHVELLENMRAPMPDLRPAVLRAETVAALRDLLASSPGSPRPAKDCPGREDDGGANQRPPNPESASW